MIKEILVVAAVVFATSCAEMRHGDIVSAVADVSITSCDRPICCESAPFRYVETYNGLLSPKIRAVGVFMDPNGSKI